MIQLIAVHEPTPEKLAMWLWQNKITYQQFSAAIAGVENPESAVPPPPKKPSLFRRFLAWLKK